MRIDLIPLVGARIDGVGEINFGQTIKEIKAVLGEPSLDEGKKLYYDDMEFRLDFDKKNKLEFIELIEGPFTEKIEPVIYGIDPFKMPAAELVALLSSNGNNEVDDSEAEYAYTFPEISVGVWRDLTEAVMNETIAELKERGEYEAGKSAFDQDLEKSKFFWTIAIGVKDYYKI